MKATTAPNCAAGRLCEANTAMAPRHALHLFSISNPKSRIQSFIKMGKLSTESHIFHYLSQQNRYIQNRDPLWWRNHFKMLSILFHLYWFNSQQGGFDIHLQYKEQLIFPNTSKTRTSSKQNSPSTITQIRHVNKKRNILNESMAFIYTSSFLSNPVNGF